MVTILFADVTSSTALGERLDPEWLQEVLATYFGAMREEIEAEGGTVEKFIGDAVMAAFGVPTAHEDDPARALRAALRMRERLTVVNNDLARRFGVTLRIRTGVNTGEVLAATNPPPGEPMVTGDAVNAAARLEQGAEPGQIVVAERTARAARGFRFRELGERELRGRQASVPGVELEGAAPTPIERGVPGLRAPMVGRDRELELLRSLYLRSAAEGNPNQVTIYGDPGVGKSRLTNEFVAWTEAQDPAPIVVRGRCLPYGDGVTYWPLAEILKGLAGVRDTDPPEVALDRVRELGADLITTEVAMNPTKATAAIAFSVGLEDPAFSFREAEPREVRLKMHTAWRSLFSALAARAPVVAVIDDIHWADPALLDLLEELADRVVGPVLFVCPARPELSERRPGWGGGRRNVSSISLDPLTSEESDRLIELLLSVDDLPPAVHARILERAEGNPFFLEEIVRHLIDEGSIVRDGRRWHAAADIGDVQIPDTVQAVLAARIDLLDPIEKRALQRAAVVGRVFWPEPVGRLLNGDRDRLRDTLDRLEERELVLSRLASSIAGEQEFIFKHVLTREVAYESLPRRERGQAHASVAEWIESTSGERRAEFAELLAYHYEEAFRSAADGDHEGTEMLRMRALEASLEASEVARRRFALEAALRLADRAVDLAVSPLERATTLEQRGLVARNDYQGDLSWESFREAVDLRLRELPQDRHAIASSCAQAVENPMRWPGSMFHPPLEEEVRHYIDLGLEHASEGSEDRIRLLTAAAFTPFGFAPLRGTTPEEVEACHELGLQAAEAALAIGRPDLASAALDGAGSALVTIGEYGGELVSIIQRRLELANSFDDPWEIGDVYDMAIWDWTMIGNYEVARAYGDRAFEMAQLGAEGLAIHGLSWLAMVELQLGNWDRVSDELGPLVESLLGPRSDDPPYFTQNMMGSLAVIEVVRGDPEQRHLGVLRRMAEAKKFELGVGGLTAWLAWALLLRGSTSEAEASLEDSDRSGFRGHLPLLHQVRADFIAETLRWDLVPAFVSAARRYSADAGLVALPYHLDRLEGRHALAEGKPAAASFLERSRDGFASLSARWELARTDRLLAEALADQGRVEDARESVSRAARVFEELGAAGELQRARSLADRLA